MCPFQRFRWHSNLKSRSMFGPTQVDPKCSRFIGHAGCEHRLFEPCLTLIIHQLDNVASWCKPTHCEPKAITNRGSEGPACLFAFQSVNLHVEKREEVAKLRFDRSTGIR